MSYNPYQSTPGVKDPIVNRQVAESRVKLPAIFLMISGGVSMLFNVIGGAYFAVMFIGAKEQMMAEIRKQQQQDIPAETLDMIFNLYGFGGIASVILGLIFGVFVIFAAIRMLKLRGWGMAVAAAIISLIPCFQGCCLLSMPVGIFALVVLMDGTVKPAFE